MKHPIENPTPSAAETIQSCMPPEVANLANTTLLERLALAEILRRPTRTNAGLARLLGLSVRGVEAMLRRLRDRGLIKAEGKGRGRCLVPSFHVERHIDGGDGDGDKHHTNEVVQRPQLSRQPSTVDAVNFRMSAYDNCMSAGAYDAAGAHLQAVRRLLEADTEFSVVQKKPWIEGLVEAENRCVAFRVGAELAAGLTSESQKSLALAICNAPAEKLALLREQIDGGTLTLDATALLECAKEASQLQCAPVR